MKYEILKKYFGYESFKEGQEEVIDHILGGKDVLAVMPTGAGKSICYQVPALLFDGLTIVVSPLISLMKDQVDILKSSGVSALVINSTMSLNEIDDVILKCINGDCKILYVAPERLLESKFLDFARRIKISMVTVDEAHCISQWGQDFRVSYQNILVFINFLSYRPVVSCFTATATKEVRDDIVSLVRLVNPLIKITSFDRKNLYFEVKNPRRKFDELLSFLREESDFSGIIYASTRKTVDKVYEKLLNLGFKVSKYHAGLSSEERKNNQDDFLYDNVNIMVATNAFGMGIDKSNVSFVVHYNMPKDMESYYQEAGRAGRDGTKAKCLLLFGDGDIATINYLIEENGNSLESILYKQAKYRLNYMIKYCKSSICLRKMILNYFGEDAALECKNCSICDADFNLADVTEVSQKIMSCVYKTRERFGANLIIDVLRGKTNARIIQFRFDKISTFNICTESEKYLKSVIDYLTIAGYLRKSEERFPTLSLSSKAVSALKNKETIMMRQKKEAIKMEISKEKVNHKNTKLFNQLRELRKIIAKDLNVPAFVVFDDKTLVQMSLILPTNKEQFLSCPGVGEYKFNAYGEDFLNLINDFLNVEDVKKEFCGILPVDFNKNQIKIIENGIGITELNKNINEYLNTFNLKIKVNMISDFLLKNNYFESKLTSENRTSCFPTLLGSFTGITRKLVEKENRSYEQNLFDKNAQKFIIDNLENLNK